MSRSSIVAHFNRRFTDENLCCLEWTYYVLTVLTAIGVGGVTLAQHVQHTGESQVRVTQPSQRHIIEKLDGKDSSATVLEVTLKPSQEVPHTATPGRC